MKIEKKRWICALTIVAVTVVAIIMYPPVFYLNDDVTMRSILSGAYTGVPDGHAVYMQYPLTGGLALLYRIAGFVPWLELFFTACIVSCMLLVANRFENPLIGGMLAIGLYLPFCLYMHYTIVAAIVAATSVFLLVTGRRGVVPILLLVIAYMIRSQVGLLALPFVAAAMVWRMAIAPIKEWKGLLFSWGKYVSILGGSLLCCMLINQCFYCSAEWKNYKDYNESRTLLYDYTNFLSTDTYADTYSSYGMSREEYLILYSYNTMLDERIDAEKMQEVAQKVSAGMLQENTVSARLKDTVWKYYLQIRYNDAPYNLLWGGLYFLLFICFLISKKWLLLLIWGILGIGRSSIWMYFIWQGRFPERVSISLYILELLLLTGMGLWYIKDWGLSHRGMKVAVVSCCVGLGCLCLYQWQITVPKLEERAAVQSEWTVLKWYCDDEPEHLYLMDVFSSVKYSDMQYTKDVGNLKLLGGWMSASPLVEECFAQLGFADGAEALFYGKEVSLIATKETDVSWLEEYLQKRFGDCRLVAVGEINSRNPQCFVEYMVQK